MAVAGHFAVQTLHRTAQFAHMHLTLQVVWHRACALCGYNGCNFVAQ